MSKTRDNFIGFAMDQSRWNNLPRHFDLLWSLMCFISVLNPLIYSFFGQNFRRQVINILQRIVYGESVSQDTPYVPSKYILIFTFSYVNETSIFLNFQIWPSQDNCSKNGKWRASLRKGTYFDFVFELRFLDFLKYRKEQICCWIWWRL